MLKALQSLASKQQANITTHEVGADFIIGLDTNKNMLFFLKNTAEKTIENTLLLSDYKECRVLKFGKNGNARNTSHTIETLKLEFIPKFNTQPTTQLELFNEDTNIQLNGELEIVNTWHPILQQKIAEA
ncbi:hypothetical protein FNB79_12310 [Formosa sediminum]|uniref:Uncharacterized protein n=1 Tax=Formosa sediminum TaxID=2594004 RepID=A0A516GT62_9FLAO|nr:hypothetical protein [Formosa sediminum]QDO94711.1 hypothetical protein FNB79_12310 [Formosa sediminum]